jgi:hypothetical protein
MTEVIWFLITIEVIYVAVRLLTNLIEDGY